MLQNNLPKNESLNTSNQNAKRNRYKRTNEH